MWLILSLPVNVIIVFLQYAWKRKIYYGIFILLNNMSAQMNEGISMEGFVRYSIMLKKYSVFS